MEYARQYLLALRLLEYVPAKVSELDDAELVELFRSLLVAGTIHLESGAHDGLLASGELNRITSYNVCYTKLLRHNEA